MFVIVKLGAKVVKKFHSCKKNAEKLAKWTDFAIKNGSSLYRGCCGCFVDSLNPPSQ
jgi:hypothetical protein